MHSRRTRRCRARMHALMANITDAAACHRMSHAARIKKLAKFLFSGVLSKAMKPARFAYYAPQSMDEAVAMLAQVAPDDGRVIAGGQSLVPAMALRLSLPAPPLHINPD